jgi:signal transduction histidine kinase
MRKATGGFEDRLRELGLGEGERDALRRAGRALASRLPELARGLTSYLVKLTPLLFSSDPSRAERLTRAQERHLHTLLVSPLGPEWAAAAAQVGRVHDRVGVTAAEYVASSAHLLTRVIALLSAAKLSQTELGQIDAVCRVVLLDLSIVLDAYFDSRQQRLKQSEARFASVMGSLGEPVLTLSPRLEVVAAYGSGRLKNHPVAHWVGRGLEHVMGLPADELHRALRPAFDGAPTRVEWQSEGLTFLVSAAPHALPDGSHGAVLVLYDVTAQREREPRALSTERLAMLGTLAAGVAHEVNTPLTFISANLTHVLERLPAGDERAALDEALDGADRVAEIVKDLRLFSREEAPGAGPIDVDDSIRRALRLASPELRRSSQVHHRPSGLRALGREARLTQVLVNLVVNAAQAGVAERPNQITVCAAAAPGGWVTLEVSDTGAGIDPQVLPRVFNAFFTTKPRGVGTGLGLSISQSLVAAMGGQLKARSTPGQGSTFEVWLPSAP